MTSNEASGNTGARSTLLRVVAGFLFVGAAFSLMLVLSDQAKALGPAYQASLAAASVISAAAAFGLWQHRKWGAWIYIGLTVVNQPFLYLMGWWVWGALIIPGVVIALILLKYKFLK